MVKPRFSADLLAGGERFSIAAHSPEKVAYLLEDVGVLLQKRTEAIADEFSREYFLREGVVRWTIDQDSAAYPLRSHLDKILRKNKEYQNHGEFSGKYIIRTIKKGTCIKIKDAVYVLNGEIGLEFKIKEENLSTIVHPCGAEFPLYNFIMEYEDWREIHLVPIGWVARKPDIIYFSQTLMNWKLIGKLFSQKD